MTVEQAVLQVVIEYVERGKRDVPNYVVELAHKEHQMSGRARLRGLRKKRLVQYRAHDNEYEVLTPIEDLKKAWEGLTGRAWSVY